MGTQRISSRLLIHLRSGSYLALLFSLARESGTRAGTALGSGLASTSGTGGDTGITETRRDAGELGTGRVSSEFCCPVSAILDSDISVPALEGGHTFGHTSMESMPDNKPEEDTNRLERE
jgi:hypothetical protein